jgi:hypothetical protein
MLIYVHEYFDDIFKGIFFMNTKRQLFTCLVTLGLLSTVKPVLAATNGEATDPQLQKVVTQTAALEHQMKMLKAEIRELKSEQKTLKTSRVESVPTAHRALVKSSHSHVWAYGSTGAVRAYPVSDNTGVTSDMYYVHNLGSPIVISSYLGEHTSFDASDLIINYSSYNESLNLLRLKQRVFRRLNCDTDSQTLPFLMLSGKVEGIATYQKPSNDVSNSSINLEDAELDFAPVINDWASGFVGLQYLFVTEPSVSPRVVNTSRVHVNKAFVTFGNLERLPVYLTMGQENIPFGQYSSPMITSPLTDGIFKTRAQEVLLGYANQDAKGFYASLYAFNGDTRTNRTNSINNVGANVGYVIKNNNWNTEFGGGVISNVADSFGMQLTGAPGGFGGFSTTAIVLNGLTLTTIPSEKIQHQVSGADVHATFATGPFSVITEYIQATKEFSPMDMTFNGHGAEPKALDVEGNYSFHVMDKPAALSIGYGKSWDALALNVPETRYIAAFTTSLCKDTIEELEFRHDVAFGSGDTASGFTVATPAALKGFSSNTITAQIGVYF